MKSYVKKLISAVLMLSLLGACATLPPPELFDLKSGARIGVASGLVEIVGHKHFGGWGKEITRTFDEVHWGLNEYLHSEFRRVLSEKGYEYVGLDWGELENKGVRTRNLFKVDGSQWALAADAEPSIRYLKSGLNLDAVINYEPNVYKVKMSCSAWGCIERTFPHSGLYSLTLSSMLSLSELFVVFPFRNNIVILDPVTIVAEPDYVGSHDSLTSVFAGRPDPHRRRIKKFKPNDIELLTESEISRVESELRLLITENVEREVRKLTSKE